MEYQKELLNQIGEIRGNTRASDTTANARIVDVVLGHFPECRAQIFVEACQHLGRERDCARNNSDYFEKRVKELTAGNLAFIEEVERMRGKNEQLQKRVADAESSLSTMRQGREKAEDRIKVLQKCMTGLERKVLGYELDLVAAEREIARRKAQESQPGPVEQEGETWYSCAWPSMNGDPNRLVLMNPRRTREEAIEYARLNRMPHEVIARVFLPKPSPTPEEKRRELMKKIRSYVDANEGMRSCEHGVGLLKAAADMLEEKP